MTAWSFGYVFFSFRLPSPQVLGLSDSESASMTDNKWDSATECGMTSESESEPEYSKYVYKNDFDSSSASTGNGHQETGFQVQNSCYPSQYSLSSRLIWTIQIASTIRSSCSPLSRVLFLRHGAMTRLPTNIEVPMPLYGWILRRIRN